MLYFTLLYIIIYTSSCAWNYYVLKGFNMLCILFIYIYYLWKEATIKNISNYI